MRLSVIVPTLNEAACIGAHLAALVATPGFAEIIVVDGGSTDETVTIAEAFPGVQVLRSPPGRGTQMNRGAAVATGEAMLFLHADVTLPADAERWIRQTLDHPATVAGAFRTLTVATHEGRLFSRLLRLADLRSRYARLPYGDQAVFVRSASFHAVGGFPDAPLMEDLELAIRLQRIGRIRTVPAQVRVSGRRFEAHPLYYALLMSVFPSLYRLGAPPSLLARWYKNPR